MKTKNLFYLITIFVLTFTIGFSETCEITDCSKLLNVTNCDKIVFKNDLFCSNDVLIKPYNVSQLKVDCNDYKIGGSGTFLKYYPIIKPNISSLKKITIVNCKLKNFKNVLDIKDLDLVVLKDNDISSVSSTVLSGQNIKSLVISDNNFENNQRIFNLKGGVNLNITNNQFKDNLYSTINDFFKVTIINNQFKGENSFNLNGILEIIFSNNVINFCKLNRFLSVVNSNINISNNLFSNDVITGYLIQGVGKGDNTILIINNNFTNNIGNLISLSNTKNILFKNYFENNQKGKCIYISNSKSNISENVFTNNDIPFYINGNYLFLYKNNVTNSIENPGTVQFNGISYGLILNNTFKDQKVSMNNINFNEIKYNYFLSVESVKISNALKNEIYGNIFNVSSNKKKSFELSGLSKDNKIYNNLFLKGLKVNTKNYNIWNLDPPINGTNIIGGPVIGGNAYYPDYLTCNVSKRDYICDFPKKFNENNIDYYPLANKSKILILNKTKETTKKRNIFSDIEIFNFKLNLLYLVVGGLIFIFILLLVVFIIIKKHSNKNKDLAIKEDHEIEQHYNNEEKSDSDNLDNF